jgi:autotransporter-associated beta strand protein
MKPRYNYLLGKTILAAALSLIASAPAAFAANTTYTWTGGNSTWSTSTNWNPNIVGGASGQGNIVRISATNTITLDTNITIGVICIANGAANPATVTSSGGSILTMDGTGVTTIRATSTAGAQVAGEAYLGSYQNNSVVGLRINADINMASALGVGGSVNANTVTLGTTANSYKIRNSTSTTKTLNLRAQSTGAITINSSIGVDQTQGTGGIDIVYLSSNTGAATINGNIGGATGTGQAITITNSAGSTGNFNILGTLGQSISSITQNSATSMMEITTNASNTNYAGGFSIKNGTLSLKGPGGNTAVNFGSGTVLLGDTTGSASATLAITNSNTFSNNITVQAGSSGTKSLNSLSTGGSPILSGSLVLNDSLTVGGNDIGINYTFSGVANTIASGKTLNLTQGSTTFASTYTLSGKFSGDGAIATSGTTTQSAIIRFSSTNSDYSGGTTLGTNGALAIVEIAANTTAGVGSFGSGTILLNGASLRADTGADRSLSNAITIGADTTFTTQASEKSLTFAGATTLTGNRTLTVDTGSTVAGKSVTFSNAIGQDVAGRTLTKAGAGVLNLNGANTYTGDTRSSAGTLALGNVNALAGSTLDMNGADTGAITFTVSGTNTYNLGGLKGSRALNANGNTLSVGANNSSTDYSGALSNGALTKTGNGMLTLTSNTHSYTGATNVNAGTLVVNGNISTSNVIVSSGATIGGSGTVGALTIQSGGFVNPGNSPGILNTGDYNQAGTLVAEINGLTAGTEHDQIRTTGMVTLSGALDIQATGGTYAVNSLIFLILNDDIDAINGAFSNYAEGANVGNFGGFDWVITYYANGDSLGSPSFTGGNDVALMAIPESSTALLGGLSTLLLLRRRRLR